MRIDAGDVYDVIHIEQVPRFRLMRPVPFSETKEVRSTA